MENPDRDRIYMSYYKSQYHRNTVQLVGNNTLWGGFVKTKPKPKYSPVICFCVILYSLRFLQSRSEECDCCIVERVCLPCLHTPQSASKRPQLLLPPLIYEGISHHPLQHLVLPYFYLLVNFGGETWCPLTPPSFPFTGICTFVCVLSTS